MLQLPALTLIKNTPLRYCFFLNYIFLILYYRLFKNIKQQKFQQITRLINDKSRNLLDGCPMSI